MRADEIINLIMDNVSCDVSGGSSMTVAVLEKREALVDKIEEILQGVVREESGRCIDIVEYSVDNAHDRLKTVARIREGHTQHLNVTRQRP